MQLEIVQRCVVQYSVMWDADWNCDSDTADVLHKRYTHRTVSDASPVAGTLESAIGFVSDGPSHNFPKSLRGLQGPHTAATNRNKFRTRSSVFADLNAGGAVLLGGVDTLQGGHRS